MTPDDFILDQVCNERGCPYYSVAGYIYCVHHLYGFPERAPEKDCRRRDELLKAEPDDVTGHPH